MGEVVTFPSARHPMSNVGLHGYPEPQDDCVPVDVCGAVDGFAVLIYGRRYRVFRTLSNAARVAEHLRGLDALGCLEDVDLPLSGDIA